MILLSDHFREFGLGACCGGLGDVDDGGGLLAIHATALDGELVVGGISGLSLANGLGRAEGELIAGAGCVEDGFLVGRYGLLG